MTYDFYISIPMSIHLCWCILLETKYRVKDPRLALGNLHHFWWIYFAPIQNFDIVAKWSTLGKPQLVYSCSKYKHFSTGHMVYCMFLIQYMWCTQNGILWKGHTSCSHTLLVEDSMHLAGPLSVLSLESPNQWWMITW